jgi:hypothetical protein
MLDVSAALFLNAVISAANLRNASINPYVIYDKNGLVVKPLFSCCGSMGFIIIRVGQDIISLISQNSNLEGSFQFKESMF